MKKSIKKTKKQGKNKENISPSDGDTERAGRRMPPRECVTAKVLFVPFNETEQKIYTKYSIYLSIYQLP